MLEPGVKEIFVIPFHPVDGRIDDLNRHATLLDNARPNAFDGLLPGFRVANNPSLADVVPAGFKLRFDQDDSGSLPAHLGRAERSQNRRDNQRR
jgi:hypothetical protein